MIHTLSRIRSNVLPHKGIRLLLLREEGRRSRDDLLMWLARVAPPRVVYFFLIQGVAHCTTGKRGSTNPGDLGAMDVIKVYGDDHRLHGLPGQE